jgi:hypothetical protein
MKADSILEIISKYHFSMNPIESAVGLVALVPMQQLAEAKSLEDDWTGLQDQKERRKRQTRLALRSLRMSYRALLQ